MPTVPPVTSRYWPLADLRLTTPDLVLRPPTESELEALADLLPADVELDPAAPTMPGAPAATVRGTVLLQSHWRARGTWRPESWALGLGVFRDGEPIGHQVLEAEDFARLRTVDSSSFLTTAARGHGFGKQMRAAVLALAFGPLAGAGGAQPCVDRQRRLARASPGRSGTSRTASCRTGVAKASARWHTCGSTARRGRRPAGRTGWACRASRRACPGSG